MVATLQVNDGNLYARLVSWQQPANPVQPQIGLNMGSATWGASQTRQSNFLQTMIPCTVIFLIQLTSGSLPIAISNHTGTPNYGSPDISATISDTALHAYMISTSRFDSQVTTGKNMVSIQGATGGGGAAVIARACALVLGLFPLNAAGAVKKSYHEAPFAINGLDMVAGGAFDYLLTF